MSDKCPCGGVILADTEDWKIPVCCNCWEEIGSPIDEPVILKKLQAEIEIKKQGVRDISAQIRWSGCVANYLESEGE